MFDAIITAGVILSLALNAFAFGLRLANRRRNG
jgi:hypothetical protein